MRGDELQGAFDALDYGELTGAAPLLIGRRSDAHDGDRRRPTASYGGTAKLEEGGGEREMSRRTASSPWSMGARRRGGEGRRRRQSCSTAAAGGGEEADGDGDSGLPGTIPSARR